LVIALLLLALAVAAGFVFAEQLLRVSHEPKPANAIVVLGGEPIKRARSAAPLLTNGFAPRVILSGTGDCEENARLLKQFGVTTNIVELECQSTSTQENALYTVKLLRERKCQRVIIVTSWFHSRRALSCFRKYAPEIEFISVPAPRTGPWKYERGYIAAEYAKIIVYAFRYGIFPWTSG
jgi:uncharacterized SAM-binding protein YcdF (DUF218 family)